MTDLSRGTHRRCKTDFNVQLGADLLKVGTQTEQIAHYSGCIEEEGGRLDNGPALIAFHDRTRRERPRELSLLVIPAKT